MANVKWRQLAGLDPGRLRQARLTAHYAVQWLARASRAYLAPLPDDGHTNLGWDETIDGFVAHRLPDGVRLGVRIGNLALVLDGAAFALGGRTEAEARAWLGGRLAARGFDPARLDAKPPYEMPEHALARGAAYAGGMADALAELAAWFTNAGRMLGAVREAMAARGFTASPVRCWPHHFDLATLALLDDGGADRVRSVNAGLSPGDAWYDEPYFYVSPYPYPAASALPQLPAIGHWHTSGFTAAVAPATRILAAPEPMAAAEDFLRAAADGALKALA